MVLWRLFRMSSNASPLNRLKHTKNILRAHRMYSSIEQGSKYGSNYKLYLKLPNGEIGSFFHDVPIDLNFEQKTARMVVEVPRWSNAKFEISKEMDFNPIVQDQKKGKVRFVHNIFPYHGYIHNYGAIPQTWEDPTISSSHGGSESLVGDNDPLDCCEIGSNILHTGEIKTVKILGSLALIDDGELDWKVIVIDIEDPLAKFIHNINDIEKHMPGILKATREWFRNYKIPAGNPANQFAFEEEYQDVVETMKTIRGCNNAWKRLVNGEMQSTDITELPKIIRAGNQVFYEADKQASHPIPPELNKWWYI